MIHVCIRCELKYTSDYPRAGLCPRCWAEENQINLGKLARGLIDMVEMLEADLVECQRAAARAGLSPDLKKRLLMLAHPDKHGGSPLATRVFQELRGMQ
ncbi:J domain-containing protein [Acidithiobacillus caldus]|uniref:J domain-containing protein n=1 Tax=Acidithiobacillus caldus TaxID=33059 RepID=UPI001C07DAEC|nr:J domain-containing protein [Acidithiobacillus caldus]MBU2801691.1 J domain-containing protein [Acidithiobacillus caldus]